MHKNSVLNSFNRKQVCQVGSVMCPMSWGGGSRGIKKWRKLSHISQIEGGKQLLEPLQTHSVAQTINFMLRAVFFVSPVSEDIAKDPQSEDASSQNPALCQRLAEQEEEDLAFSTSSSTRWTCLLYLWLPQGDKCRFWC